MKNNKNNNIPSLIKWTGSKRGQAEIIQKYIPEFNRYFEPFLGGGAMLYINAHPGAVASDIYSPLVELWKLIRDDVDDVIDHYRAQWKKLQKNLPGYYYFVRERYNKNNDPLDLLFLTRTCVNGIIRFNKNGDFNNSFHLSRNGMTPDNFSIIAHKWSHRIQGVKFISANYQEAFSKAKKGDFLYLDPPYSKSNNRYIKDLNVDRFFKDLRKLNQKGIRYALSFDGMRGDIDLTYNVPKDIYSRKVVIDNGHSALNKVLNKINENVGESLYLNY